MEAILQQGEQAAPVAAADKEVANIVLPGNESSETLAEGTLEPSSLTNESSTTVTNGDDFEDEPAYLPGDENPRDILLFPNDLPEIEIETDNFFADIYDLANAGAKYDGNDGRAAPAGDIVSTESQPSTLASRAEDSLFPDAVFETAITSVEYVVYEFIEHCDARLHPEYIPAAPTEHTAATATPLLEWVHYNGTHRHELRAYLLGQATYPVGE